MTNAFRPLSAIGAILLFISAMPLRSAAEEAAKSPAPPSIDHILIDVVDVERSLQFYRDQLHLTVKSRSPSDAVLQAGNLRIFLWSDHWDWSPPPHRNRPPQGMYPHFVIPDVKGTVASMEKAGFKIVEPAQDHPYGTEAFVADPDGYVWALISQ